MPLTAKDLWKRILDDAKRDVPEPMIQTWLAPNTPVEFDSGTLTVNTPDDFAKRWNEEKYGAVLGRIATTIVGEPVAVSFAVAAERQERPQMDLFVPQAARNGDPAAAPTTNPNAQPLNERYTFGHFVIGKSNELAAAASHAVAAAPGKQYNPFFIYGPTGLGKTHLMQAIAHEVLVRTPETRVLYISAEDFVNQVIEGIHNRTMTELRKRYRSDVDLFLVDDIHFLEGKEATQEEFFHTFNALYEAGKQIVLTSDRAPKEIPGLEARLVSRFEWGMVADVKSPDLEHRIAILQKKQQQDHLETTIPDDVLRFIAESVRSNVRELEGCIIKLLLYASLRHREISIELAREALADKIRPGDDSEARARSLPSIEKVQEVVARRWGVTPEGLRSKARIKTLTVPRQIAMFLARELLQMQLVEIGQAFGGRDHSTVIHSVDKVQSQLQRDRQFRDRVDSARQELLTV
ncbi:MAG TPA: chromosomal replication initiator protein DnaA [Gemmatimonadales bacterium]|nr:chromosomal replication initiator protein DnaA [Gemmatimonadales bacterium]